MVLFCPLCRQAEDDWIGHRVTPTPLPICTHHRPLDSQGWAWDIDVAPDRQVWLGTSSGAARFDPTTGAWTKYLAENWPLKDEVKSVTADPDGSVWMTTAGGAVHNFDGILWTAYTVDDGLISDHVNRVSVAPDGSVWFATTGGVSRWDRETEAWTHFTKADGLLWNTVSRVLFTPDGTVWFAHRDAVTYLTPAKSPGEQDLWQVFPESEQMRQAQTGEFSRATTSSDGRVWFTGHWFFDPDRQEWGETVYDDFAYDLAVDGSGGLWIATGRGAIFIPDPTSSAAQDWRHFGTAQGLASDDIRRVALEADDVVWFGMENATLSRCVIRAGSE